MSWPHVGNLVAQMLDGRDHPVDELVAYGVRYSCVKTPRRAPVEGRGGGGVVWTTPRGRDHLVSRGDIGGWLHVGGCTMEEHTAVAVPSPPLPPAVVERMVISGDLSELNAAQRADYYAAICRSLELNPRTKPFAYLTLQGKLRLYALRDCAEQLRRLHGISIYIANRERLNDIYVVTARAKDRHGREDESTGAVPLGNLRGDALANALMKAETKAKRRVTLSIAGLGWLDETELDTMPQSPHAVMPSEEPLSSEEPPGEGHPTGDQINSLVEMATSCGVDLTSFGNHMRRLMQLPAETTITKKFSHST